MSGVLYLGTADSTVAHWAGPIRRARVVRELHTPNGNPCWIVEVDPPIPAGDGTDLQRVVLANRLSGWSVERLATLGSQENQLGWTEVYVLRLQDPEFDGDRLRSGDYSIAHWAEVALDPDRLPKPLDVAEFWNDTRARIRRFIDEHGHSRFPEPYFDADGKRLDVIVENIRWHHAGKAGVSPGPFPGIDYAAALDELPGWEWWSVLEGSLEALVVAHDLIGSPLREELRAGPPASLVEATIRGLGLTPPSELIEFFAWHDLEARPGSAGRTDWFWPVGGFRLTEAVDEYRRSVEIGGITPDEIGDNLPPDANPATTTFTGFWRTDWFPILGGVETYAVECPGRGRSPGAVWRVNWHPDSEFQTQRVAPSLAALIDAAVDLFRAGAYRWDATYQAIVTVDDVFERRGLTPEHRPIAWP